MKVLQLIVCIASAVLSVNAEGGVRGLASHPVCYKILNTWWNTREAQKTRSIINTMDQDCSVFTGTPDPCNKKTTRGGIAGLTPAQKVASCTMVGAHNSRCIGNPCNSLNTGDCSIQQTQGQCFWITKENLPKINAYYVSQGIAALPTHGCYRNPCNLPGYGKQDQECPTKSIPGVLECTWCKGGGDPLLLGEGMGCQMTIDTTQSLCAPVNSNGVPKSSVMERVVNARCQCSTDYTICDMIVSNTRSQFRPAYPNAG